MERELPVVALSEQAAWPAMPLEGWEATRDTLHMWTQIVGKVRMAHAAPLNHWWHVTLYVEASGLSTSLVPHRSGGFEIRFDFVDHQLLIRRVDGRERRVALEPRSVADFYHETLAGLGELEIEAPMMARPVEVEDTTPFGQVHHHGDYDREAVERFWRSLVDTHRVFSKYRSYFSGKSSPVHFFWGSFDLAVTRFSGRRAPLHPGGALNCPDWVMHEAYSQEVSSAGYWPGGAAEGLFYAYAYPSPATFEESEVEPTEAHYDTDLGEFVLPYQAVRLAPDPDAVLSRFLHSTYGAVADLAGWPPDALEMPADGAPPWTTV